MTYATMLIASLIIAFTPGAPAQRIPLANPHIRGADFSLRLHHIPAPRRLKSAPLFFRSLPAVSQSPALPATFNVSGQVLLKGKPPGVEGVEIVFERVSSKGPAPNSVRTDANGQWRQSSFQQGTTYRAIPKKQGFVFDPVSLEFSAGTRGSLLFDGRPTAGTNAGTKAIPSIKERPSAGINQAVERLPKNFAASGEVTTPDGRGIPGVKIIFSLASGTGAAPGEVETDAQGKWTQSGFDRDASYTIRPRRLPGDTFTPPVGTVSQLRLQNFRITIPKFAASGRVGARTRGIGLANVVITFSLESGAGPVPAAVTTNERGEWFQQGFEIGARYKATPSKGGFQFTPGSRTIVHVGTVGTQPSAQLRDVDFSVPDVFVVSGVITSSEAREQGVEVVLKIRAVSGGESGQNCHKTRIGSRWSKELETGKTYIIKPDAFKLDLDISPGPNGFHVFTPEETRVDAPKNNADFSGRVATTGVRIVQRTSLGSSCTTVTVQTPR